MKEHSKYFIIWIGAMLLITCSMHKRKTNTEVISYCKIDSIVSVSKNTLTPEKINKCWTDCGETFVTNKDYKIGDSIQIKTIIVNE